MHKHLLGLLELDIRIINVVHLNIAEWPKLICRHYHLGFTLKFRDLILSAYIANEAGNGKTVYPNKKTHPPHNNNNNNNNSNHYNKNTLSQEGVAKKKQAKPRKKPYYVPITA